jgi:hypothetical protein
VIRRIAPVALLLGSSAVVSLSASVAAGQPSCLEKPFANASFGQLGLDRVFEADQLRETQSATVLFPADAKQGECEWLIADLHVAVKLKDAVPPDDLTITVATNGAVAVRARTSSTDGNVLYADGAADGYGFGASKFVGQTSQFVDGRAEVWASNYLQFAGVKHGPTSVSVRIEAADPKDLRKIESVTVYPDSGLRSSSTPPSGLKLAMESRAEDLSTGESAMKLQLHLQSGTPNLAPQVRVAIVPLNRNILILPNSTVLLSNVSGPQTVEFSIVTPDEPAQFTMSAIRSDYAIPSEATFEIGRMHGEWSMTAFVKAALPYLASLLACISIYRLALRRPAHRPTRTGSAGLSE